MYHRIEHSLSWDVYSTAVKVVGPSYKVLKSFPSRQDLSLPRLISLGVATITGKLPRINIGEIVDLTVSSLATGAKTSS